MHRSQNFSKRRGESDEKPSWQETRNLAESIAAAGVGIALYVVLSLCLQVPVFENYYLCLGYIVLGVYCCTMGPIYGGIIGLFGCILHCLLINGLRGMPGWALGNLVIGILLGLVFRFAERIKSRALRYAMIAVSSVVITAVGILGIKSLVEMILYTQPLWARAVKNSYAFVADCVVLVVSIPICYIVKRAIQKSKS